MIMTPQQEALKNDSAPGDRPEAPPTGAEARRAQINYTPAPSAEELKESFNRYIQFLPPDLRARFERFNQVAITEALSVDNPPAGLEGLLPALRTLDAAKILRTEYSPTPWIIPDFLPAGLLFLIGKPKVGKSWLGMQIALSVMTGGKMLNRDVEKGRVLYLALEDNERRLQKRMVNQNWPTMDGMVDFMFYGDFREQITALNAGGGKRLLRYIEQQKYRVVIVDTFSRAIQGDQLDPAEMTEAVGPLQQYALNQGIGLVMIDHMPKNTGEVNDPIGHIYGSVAKAAVLDTAWALYKEQGKAGAKLAINGRETEEEYLLKLTFEKRGCYWSCEGNAADVTITETRKAILAALEDLGKSQAMPIAEATGQPLNHVRERLNDLVNEGRVSRFPSGQSVFFELVKAPSSKKESRESRESSTSRGRKSDGLTGLSGL
jgi:hypothetical protein